MDSLLGFEANDFDTTPDAVKKDSASPAATITISTSDNRDFTVTLGARITGDQYPCVLSGGSVAYLLPEWRVEQVLAARDSLVAQ